MHTDELITEIPTLGKATLPSPLKKEAMKRVAVVLFQIKAGLSLK